MSKPLTEKERKLRDRLHRLWATKRATRAQILRCMELDRTAEFHAKANRT